MNEISEEETRTFIKMYSEKVPHVSEEKLHEVILAGTEMRKKGDHITSLCDKKLIDDNEHTDRTIEHVRDFLKQVCEIIGEKDCEAIFDFSEITEEYAAAFKAKGESRA